MSDKIYVKGVWAKSRQTSFGEVISLNCKAAELVAFIQANTDAGGWIKFDISPKRQPDEKTTHSVSLNTWKPGERKEQRGYAPKPAAPKLNDTPPQDDPDSQVPF